MSMGKAKVEKPKEKPKKRRTRAQRIEDILGKLSIKERRLIEARLAGKTKTEAADYAGYVVAPKTKTKNLCTLATRRLERPEVKQALTVLLEQYNLGIDRLLRKISEGTDATKVVALVAIPIQKTGEESKSGNELQDASEQTQNYAEVPDMPTRLNYIKTALALHGLPDKDKGEGEGETYAERIRAFWRRQEEMAIDTTATEVK
ncbi:hypothetical protein [Candidatus Manganitrophus noduliformans]|uniref:Uncharacterized protein n=1 Tax=Candidatus Manganitrophus noduliformans TaxID=2606439 RepID=A0A7X6DMK0_9BACT|nr:hypothetical protein [Candidatus Manganitrophus noduliformans]NKE69872.1 hypothetical protein [Candidatus Manganitrophus noduliformans]